MANRALAELIYTNLQVPPLEESGIDKTIEVSSATIQAPDPVLGLDPGPKPIRWHADCICGRHSKAATGLDEPLIASMGVKRPQAARSRSRGIRPRSGALSAL
jgi:hypothetical protein